MNNTYWLDSFLRIYNLLPYLWYCAEFWMIDFCAVFIQLLKQTMKGISTMLVAIALLACTLSVAQENKPTWGSDINIAPVAGKYYKNVRTAVAYNGDVYVGRLVADAPDGPYKRWEVYKSLDGGITWSLYYNNFASVYIYTSFDIIAAGENASDFRLYVARGTVDTATNKARITCSFVNTSGFTSFSYEEYTSIGTSQKTQGFVSLAWATDSKAPAKGSKPYTISLAATKWDSPRDSVVVWSTSNPDSAFRRKAWAGDASNYLRKIDAAMGSNNNTTRPYLGVAYESQNLSGTESVIKTRFLYADNLTSTPSGIMELSDTTTRYVNPSIAMSQTNGNPATGYGFDSVKVIVAYEAQSKSIAYKTVNYRVIQNNPFGSYASYGSSRRMSQAGESSAPHIIYDPAHNNFLATYYNATNGSLPYLWKPLTAADSIPFNIATSNYRDAATLPTPSIQPRLDINNNTDAVFAWDDNYLSMFDAEKSTYTSVGNIANTSDLKVYPNPASSFLNFSTQSEIKNISIYNLLGAEVLAANSIENKHINITDLTAGVYLLKVTLKGYSTPQTFRFVKE